MEERRKRITPETPIDTLCKISDSELYHYGIKGMRWGVTKKSNEYPIGMNYRTEGAPPVDGGGGEVIEESEEDKERLEEWEKKLKKLGRYVEAADYWLQSRLHTRVVDTFTGKSDNPSWQQAKEWVDYTYHRADPDLFLTDKYL